VGAGAGTGAGSNCGSDIGDSILLTLLGGAAAVGATAILRRVRKARPERKSTNASSVSKK
jgi:hypothetical protein